ncbi:hypothetical protein chiPu_0015390 [Chiloscyllium punctatum]|uniref:Uncharacterized protein n=1 Tax=Chiloscyllium punctatum TaxID=137246 RepID=A0A401T2N2_CHIPU|nr:hypothetical protein [Chiloscyllium punctatum]
MLRLESEQECKCERLPAAVTGWSRRDVKVILLGIHCCRLEFKCEMEEISCLTVLQAFQLWASGDTRT